MSELDRPLGERRSTESYPVIQRKAVGFFRGFTQSFIDFFRQVGVRGYFLRDIGRAFGDPATFVPETIRQMRRIGVDSIPLTVIVAAFIGGVIAIQTTTNCFRGSSFPSSACPPG